MPFYDAIRIGASGAADFEIERSLRFNSGDVTYLTRTPSSSGNRRTMTYSFWLKKCKPAAFMTLVSGKTDSSNRHQIDLLGTGGIRVWGNSGGSVNVTVSPSNLLRDTNAWYHIVVAIDTTQSTASNRVKFYFNGTAVSSYTSTTYPSQNYELNLNKNVAQSFGLSDSGPDVYFAEINFIDGLALTPSSFAETNVKTGQWVPKNTAGLTFGTNGYRLQFADPSNTTATTLGKDTSGNGNNFTPNNFSITAGTDDDSFTDTPTINFPTLNATSPASSTNGTLSKGNLVVPKADYIMQRANFIFGPGGIQSGKWYWEVTNLNSSSSNYANYTGITGDLTQDSGEVALQANKSILGSHFYKTYTQTSGNDRTNDGTNKTMQFLLDVDNQQLIAKYDGSTIYTDTGIPSASTNSYVPFVMTTNSGTGGSTWSDSHFNFGQRDFVYSVPSGYKLINSANLSDPTILLPNKHFDALLYTGNDSTNNITGLNFSPDWVWIKQRNGTFWHQLFDTIRGVNTRLYSNRTDAENVNSPTLTAFNSDGFTLGDDDGGINGSGSNYVAWNWNAGDAASKTYRVVVVSDSGNKYRFRNSANSATFAQSAVTLALEEGGTYTFDQSDSTMSSHPMKLSTTANGTHGGGSSYNTGVTYELDGSTVTESAFVSGFSSATSRKLIITVAASAPTLYYYCHYHSGMGGQADTFDTLGSSNFDGSVQSVVKANTTAGFSIARWTIPSDAVYTIGHGLGVAPKAIIMKARNQTTNWDVFHTSAGNTKRLKLNSTSTQEDYTGPWNDTDPTSTVFTSTGSWLNGSGTNVIAYVFSEVAGFSRFGSYTGNGNADGPFVHLGFRPAFVLTKIIDTINENWTISDSKRSTFNAVDLFLRPDEATSDTSGAATMDFLSNGFKIRNTDDKTNRNGATFIFFAFAESPFKNSRAR